MANKFWTAQNEKLITSIGIGVVGYNAVSKAFEALPSLPTWVVNPLIGQVSLLTVAGGLAIWGVIMLYTKF